MATPAGICTLALLGRGLGSASGAHSRSFIHRQIVQQVRQRFRVHQPMLDGHMQQSSVAISAVRFAARAESACSAFVSVAFATCVQLYFSTCDDARPIRRHVRWQAAVDRIDSEGKELVELRIVRR